MFKEVRTAVKLREGGGTGNVRRTLVGFWKWWPRGLIWVELHGGIHM